MTEQTARAEDAAAPQQDAPSGSEQATRPEGDSAALAELKDRLLRTLAEMENLRKRTEREISDARTYGASNFARDVLAGDRAWLGDDLAELRRLAHSLKTVLLMLGYDYEASVARLLDAAAAAGNGPEAYRLWALLRSALRKMASLLSMAQSA